MRDLFLSSQAFTREREKQQRLYRWVKEGNHVDMKVSKRSDEWIHQDSQVHQKEEQHQNTTHRIIA